MPKELTAFKVRAGLTVEHPNEVRKRGQNRKNFEDLEQHATKLLTNLQMRFEQKLKKFENDWRCWNTSQLIDWLKMIDYPKFVVIFGTLKANFNF